MLVGARWLAGLLFRWSDLEILDDPIPPRLYCQHFRTKNHDPGLTELEGGEDRELDDKSEGTKHVQRVQYSMLSCSACTHVYTIYSGTSLNGHSSTTAICYTTANSPGPNLT